jgi:hypothetical protein
MRSGCNLRERAALHILTTETDWNVLLQECAECKSLSSGPVDAAGYNHNYINTYVQQKGEKWERGHGTSHIWYHGNLVAINNIHTSNSNRDEAYHP